MMTRCSSWIAASLVVSLLLPALARAEESGAIQGHVEVLRSGSSGGGPVSPYARHRFREQAETADPERERTIAVVYLAEHPNLSPAAAPDSIPVMDQVDLTLVPHILPVTVGATVAFPNSDEVYHNLFSLSPARKFDLGRYAMGTSREVTFERVGEVQVFCDIHPHMNGVVLVLPNPWFTRVGPRGDYRIEEIPPGSYQVHAWHERLEEQVRRVTVAAGDTVTLDFVLGVR